MTAVCPESPPGQGPGGGGRGLLFELILAVSLGLLAGSAAWLVTQAIGDVFRARQYAGALRNGLPTRSATPWSGAVAEIRNVGLSSALFGAILGSALGLAGQRQVGRPPRSSRAVLIGLGSGAVVGASSALASASLYYHWFLILSPDDLLQPLLIHAGTWGPTAAACGLALGIGRGGAKDPRNGLVGGLLGGLLGTILFELIGASLFPMDRTFQPRAATGPARLLAFTLVGGFAGMAATLAMASDRRRSHYDGGLIALLATIGLTLMPAGCDADPAIESATDGPLGGNRALAQSESRTGQPGRRNYGLGDRMAFMAFADAHASVPDSLSPFRFEDIRASAGVDFVHTSGTTDARLFPTAFGSGVAIFDFDGDGRMDVYFANATTLPLDAHRSRSSTNRLYRNVGGGRFADATSNSGLGFSGFCHGIIAGDLDNDGDTDIFLCNVGPNSLYLNQGNGTFRDISRSAGIDAPGWSSGGAMLDFDNDGDLDIFVARYGKLEYLEHPNSCGMKDIPVYCSPGVIPTTRHVLYRNDGNLTFSDVTGEAGLGRDDGRGFGAVAADLDGDGLIDLYVANDLRPNFLFLNRGDGTFQDVTETSGAAYDAQGTAQSSMGVDAEDCDGDGLPELLVTNFQYEYTTYYRNVTAPGKAGTGPRAAFRDESSAVGLAIDSKPFVGWGCALADLDNDGWPDSFVTNGHLDSNRGKLGPTLTYLEPPILHRNVEGPAGTRRLLLATRSVGPYFDARHAGRGLAVGDLDDDGDLDIVINHRDDRPAILSNQTPGRNRWLRLHLVGTRSNRDAIGARVEVHAGGRTIVRQRKGGGSMQSAHDPRMLIGLGPIDEVSSVLVRWPSGLTSSLVHLRPDRTYEVREPLEAPDGPLVEEPSSARGSGGLKSAASRSR